MTESNKLFKIIGKNIRRFGAVEKTTGKPIFSADLELDSPLVLRAVRSSKDHAEIVNIDVARALEITGVVRVFTAKDIPGTNLFGIINKDQPLLAPDKVRSRADAVALIAAETETAVEQAIKAVEITYRDLPAVFDPEEAMKPDAPLIHKKGNILYTRHVKKGDVESAFKKSASVIEKIYQTSMVEHNYLEPDAAVGYVDPDGALVIMASTQNPHYDHKEIVSILGVEDEKVRIIQAVTGGGFGSKLDLGVTGFVGLALYHLKRPVRYVYSREEAYLATSKRHPLTISMKTGVDRQGRLLAVKARLICDGGAYGSYGIAVASRAAVHVPGPYAVENVEVESHCIYTNKPFCGAMRGFGVPQVAFAHESQMELHARELGLDSMEIRQVNAYRVGDETITGQTLSASIGIRECLEAVKPYYEEARAAWVNAEQTPYKKRGIGLGAMWYGIGNTGAQNPSTARIEMSADGSVTLFTGCADIGQGSTTVLTQIAAEVLGLKPEDFRVVVADTKYTTNAGATSASRQTYISGNAVKEAADKLADVLLTEAVNILKCAKRALIFDA
ncbi:MAG: xanthine dehydrogenase family protein, partial [Deltaproteobacteria bacterium]|nr:xanthine dehydrogenase family protein [Deltaproteobacteria bacterium]